jgi:Multiubiquitin
MDNAKKDNPGQGNGNDHNDDHGQGVGGQNETTIIVNTREKTVQGKIVTYDQIVALAFETIPSGENIEITVLYRDGPGPDKEGTLAPNGSVRIKKDMIFDVTATDKS